ncbi:hypothetical protein ACHAW6_004658 [Cyclotella cf. meneghiniana]
MSSQQLKGQKRGNKVGTKLQARFTNADWYAALENYDLLLSKEEEGDKEIAITRFFGSEECGILLNDQYARSQFGAKYRLYKSGGLENTAAKCQCMCKYTPVEERLIRYLDLRAQSYRRDK